MTDNDNEQEKRTQIKNVFSLLPAVNKSILRDLFAYLKKVVSTISNRMDASSVAIVFSPNLLKPKVEDPLILISTTLIKKFTRVLWHCKGDAGHAVGIVQSFIDNYDFYFDSTSLTVTASGKVMINDRFVKWRRS